MRIRRKKWVDSELKVCKFYLDTPLENKGKWNKFFKRKQPIHMELGCGKGTFISKLAVENPNINYIAVDMIDTMLGLAKRNVEKEFADKHRDIDNIVLVRMDIERILMLMDKEDKVDRIYINFCNPWPKGKHRKKRLTHTKQLEVYKTFLKNDGEIYFKTDDDDLFESSLKYFEDADFEIEKYTYNLHKEPIFENNIITEHEEMFTSCGINIKALIARRRGKNI